MEIKQEWFFSAEGEDSFINAQSLRDKISWIYAFLSCLNDNNNPKTLFKLAYIIADTMWDTPLDCSGWPNIIQDEHNPFLTLVKSGAIQDLEICAQKHQYDSYMRGLSSEYLSDMLLCALHDSKIHFVTYKELEQPGTDGCNYYIYSIEREIIWFFCNSNYRLLDLGPYGERPNNDKKTHKTLHDICDLAEKEFAIKNARDLEQKKELNESIQKDLKKKTYKRVVLAIIFFIIVCIVFLIIGAII